MTTPQNKTTQKSHSVNMNKPFALRTGVKKTWRDVIDTKGRSRRTPPDSGLREGRRCRGAGVRGCGDVVIPGRGWGRRRAGQGAP